MQIISNNVFAKLLDEYELPSDLSFSIDIPPKVQAILNDDILVTDLGITLHSFNRLYKAWEPWDNQSYIEDNENHFHVDWYTSSGTSKEAFMLGIKTLLLLAHKFENYGVKGIRFWYSFQTPELGEMWERVNGFYEEGSEKFISDRLSFFTRREGEHVISHNETEKYWANLIIDI